MQSLRTALTRRLLLGIAATLTGGAALAVGVDGSPTVGLAPLGGALALAVSLVGIGMVSRRRRRPRRDGSDGYRDVFHGVDEAVLVHDAETLDIVDANRAAVELCGYSASELRRVDVMDLTADHPEFDAATVEARLDRTLEEGSQRFDWPIQRKDGERRWVEVSLTRTTVDGEPRVVAVCRDVTDRKARIDDLERYETLAETVVDGLYITGPNGHFTYANEELAALMGYEREELLGMHIADVTPTPEVDRAWELRDDLEADPDQTKTQEFDLLTASGDTVPVEIRFTALPLSDGSQGTAGVVRDVSDRKRHEHQLEALHAVTRDLMTADNPEYIARRASEALEELLDFPLHGIHFHEDGELVPTAISLRSEELLGDPPALSVDDSLAGEVFHSGDPEVFEDLRREPDAHNPDTRVRSECIFPIGEFGVMIVSSPDADAFDQREIELVRVLAANVRAALERAQIETELERQNARLEEFASIVTHDLRNPMNVAEGHLELARELEDFSRLDDVEAAFDRMSAIIEEGLTFARLDGEMETEELHLEDVARRAWDMVATGDATLLVEADGPLRANEQRLLSLFENLFRNAVEHGSTSPDSQARQDSVEHSSTSSRSKTGDAVEHGSTGPDSQSRRDAVEHGSVSPDSHARQDAVGHGDSVTVRIGWLADGNGFYVEDTGPGIPPSERERVFEAGHTTAEGGTGLGLSIVRTVAEVHDWHHVIADGETGGARFEFSGVETP